MDTKPIRFEISQSLNGARIVYIARDQNGVVRLRAGSKSEIEKLVAEYRPPEPPAPAVDKEELLNQQINKLAETISEVKDEKARKEPAKKQTEEVTELPPEVIAAKQEEALVEKAEKKEFLKNEIREAVEELKQSEEKKSFWDRLR